MASGVHRLDVESDVFSNWLFALPLVLKSPREFTLNALLDGEKQKLRGSAPEGGGSRQEIVATYMAYLQVNCVSIPSVRCVRGVQILQLLREPLFQRAEGFSRYNDPGDCNPREKAGARTRVGARYDPKQLFVGGFDVLANTLHKS